MVKKLFSLAMLLSLLWTGTSFAFTEMTPRTLERNTRKAVHGDKLALQQFINLWSQQISKIDTKSYTIDEALARMQDLTAQKKIPGYIWERGTYDYVEGNKAVYVIGENVLMRSQPNKKANVIVKLNTESTAYLTYLGEWRHPRSSEKWVCVQNSSGEVGWVFEKYVKLISSDELRDIITRLNYVISSGAKKNDSRSEDGCGGCVGSVGLVFIVIMVCMGIAIEGEDEINSSNRNIARFDNSKEYCCPGYKYSQCCDCPRYDSFDKPVEHDDYAKCEHFKGYVHGSYTPQFNAKHVKLFEEECCPSYRKAHCQSCEYIDFRDESEHLRDIISVNTFMLMLILKNHLKLILKILNAGKKINKFRR